SFAPLFRFSPAIFHGTDWASNASSRRPTNSPASGCCFRMKETPVSREDAQTKEGPDYFAYYASQVKELISQEIDLPLSTIESTGTRTGEGVDHDVVEQRGFSGSRSLFSNSIGAGVSEYKKERLNALLPQAASALKPEVDEMLDPVISMRQLQEKLWNRDSAAGKEGTKSDGEEIADNIPQGDDDLEFLLGTDSTLVEESIKKYSDELLSTIAETDLFSASPHGEKTRRTSRLCSFYLQHREEAASKDDPEPATSKF
ncbi:unnamed protein product, partial [Linum tenue]